MFEIFIFTIHSYYSIQLFLRQKLLEHTFEFKLFKFFLHQSCCASVSSPLNTISMSLHYLRSAWNSFSNLLILIFLMVILNKFTCSPLILLVLIDIFLSNIGSSDLWFELSLNLLILPVRLGALLPFVTIKLMLMLIIAHLRMLRLLVWTFNAFHIALILWFSS